MEEEAAAATTLPDLLREGLDVVFIGINPSLPSAKAGHYFARKTNRFWPCFSRSVLSLAAREALAVALLEPGHDRQLLDYGIGFTDLVKRPTANANGLDRAELAAGVATLVAKLERYRPRIACFHGVTVYRPVQLALTGEKTPTVLGLQASRIAASRLFLLPNPSPANAHFTPAQQTEWYDRLAACLADGAISEAQPFLSSSA